MELFPKIIRLRYYYHFNTYSNYFHNQILFRHYSCKQLTKKNYSGLFIESFLEYPYTKCFIAKKFPIILCNAFSTSTTTWKKKGHTESKRVMVKVSTKETVTDFEVLDDELFNPLLAKSGASLTGITSLAVLQPWIKWGVKKRYETSKDLLLDEACALVNSIPSTAVSYKESIPVLNVTERRIFGTGTLERLVESVRKSSSQAVFVSVHRISPILKREYEELFGMKVFDRYFIVLSIFKHHARSSEARLQIAMAELPIVSKKFLSDREKLVYDKRESNLKAAVKRLSDRRERTRKNREKMALPTVAVVGYTNCGKTTFIRAVTGDLRAEGENRLFATLDVTAHKGSLPCGLDVLFIDTVGFIQDIPTTLIAAFNATLQDAILADVVLLVRDLSHPDIVCQINTVRDTLKSLPLPDTTPVIVVNNKADLMEDITDIDDRFWQEGMLTSSITGQGLKEVLQVVQKEILRVTGRETYNLRLLTGSPPIEWLKNNVAVSFEEVDEENPQYTRVQVLVNETEKAALRRAFRPDR